jgi:hypothetical protein
VAFAKGKRLPVCVAQWSNDRLVPFALRGLSPLPPKGLGNPAALQDDVVRNFAEDTLEYLIAIEQRFGVQIERVGIDAPSAMREPTLQRRAAEAALDAAGISCIGTPNSDDFARAKRKASEHLANGGAVSKMPAANLLWMLVGFALFEALSSRYECIEVYPQATAKALSCAEHHKSSRVGLESQARAVALKTGWPHNFDVIREISWGSSHDSLDAYLACWVAALPPSRRTAYGQPPSDVIWVPAMRGA